MIDPATSFLAGHLGSKVLDRLGSTFRTHVIERWSRRRAEVFFDQFCAEVAQSKQVSKPDTIESALTKIIEDEVCSEVLFDAYRRVALTRSKELGPRIIALLTAELVMAKRIADEIEDSMFLAAENLTDDELLAFVGFVRKELAKLPSTEKPDHGLRIQWGKEQFDSNWRRESGVSTAPLDLDECLGRWATKLKSYGIISDDMREREFTYSADPEAHVDQDGYVREITWWIHVAPVYVKFVELIERAASSVRQADKR
jgi:hypothetical protein